MDIQKKREAFEKLSEIAEILKNKTIKFVEKTNKYYSYHYSVEYLNGAWMAWQAKAQAVPEGFVLVKKELPEQIAEKMAIDRIDKPRHENDPVWSEIAEQAYKDQVKSKKWELWRDYKAMIEAQEPAND